MYMSDDKKEIVTGTVNRTTMYVSAISFVYKFLSNFSWPLQSYGFTFKANDAK